MPPVNPGTARLYQRDMMNWNAGLLKGFDKLLSTADRSTVEAEISDYKATWDRTIIDCAGTEIAKSLETEYYTPAAFRRGFQAAFAGLLRQGRAEAKKNLCCTHHRLLWSHLAARLASGESGWITSALDLLPALEPSLLAQLRCHSPCSSKYLSRFMPLNGFLKVHIRHPAPTAFDRAQNLLHQSIPRAARTAALRGKMLGGLRGHVGAYPNIHGTINFIVEDCMRVKNFATYKDAVDNLVGGDRTGAPEIVLKSLGLPFSKNQLWIELQLRTDDVAIEYKSPAENTLAVPTVVDARGNWAFRPDRDVPPQHGYARNLSDDSRGLPEVLFQPIDIQRIHDAIVWASPTTTNWANDSVFA